MLRKQALHNKVILLRQKGYSYKEIHKKLKVSSGTLSRWCRSVALTDQQKKRLEQKAKKNPLVCRKIKEAKLSKESAHRWVADIMEGLNFQNSKDSLLLCGVLLYWAEGTKLNELGYNGLEFTNTDHRIVRVMMSFFRTVLKVPEEKLLAMIRIRQGGNVQAAEKYWSRVTKVPLKRFRRPEILVLSPKSKSLLKYPNGICRLFVNSVYFARIVDNLIPALYKKLETDKVI